MNGYLKKLLTITLIVLTVFVTPQGLFAEPHVVTPTDLQQAIDDATDVRRQNVEKIQSLLGTPVAREAMKNMKLDAEKVISAIPTLSDQELAKISQQADLAQSDFAAGIHERDLIYLLIVVLLVIAIIVILVEAVD